MSCKLSIARCERGVRPEDEESKHVLGVDRPSVDSVEVHRLLEEAQGDRRSVDVKDDRVANVGDRDSLADARGTEGFAGEQEVVDCASIRRVDGRSLDDRAEDRPPIGAGDPVMDAPSGERSREANRDRAVAILNLALKLSRVDPDAARGSPIRAARSDGSDRCRVRGDRGCSRRGSTVARRSPRFGEVSPRLAP